MLLYKDILTDDELVSDAYPIKEVDDFLFEVDCQNIVVKKGADVDIGANPSAEGGEEEMDDDSEQVINVVYSFRLQQTQFAKKDYMTYIKGYMKAVKAKLQETHPERVADFEKKSVTFVKSVLGNFKDYDFYIGESMDPNGMVLLLNYREDGITPYFTLFKDGVKFQKL
ncbi:Translationally-controlled tumor protein [Dimargaris verticillata]|uniref:Translationally-controlled tumor protein homolog n=1 Tax=Dimargaris verticillata TaxID=2761393 RepID=A0A9W8AZZ7_9FUNG|nr:Translationally-controlled tumor protein [Dimargaris verticillata]